ncbi:MAG: SLBB domain-containing protein [Flavobacteriales bacterium]|nr:SLBB domain-containing protein [Flavobacteriales bacterium]
MTTVKRSYKWLLLLVVGIYNSLSGVSQSQSLLDLDKLSAKSAVGSSAMLTGEQVPTDDRVIPEAYMIGPGDVLSYQTTGLDFSEKHTVVTPECSVLMERVGLIKADGYTLARLRDTIRAVIKRNAPGLEIFITLRRPRLVYVSIEGNVPYPGTYAVPASMRVSTLVRVTRQPWLLRRDAAVGEQLRMRGTKSPAVVPEMKAAGTETVSPFAMRNIVVRHRDGTTLVDLARAHADQGWLYDPHLREGDVVTVPYDTEPFSSISIVGAVATPATIAYKTGDKASVLLSMAGGALDDADLNNVTLIQGVDKTVIKLGVSQDLRISGTDPELQPGSTIVVERKSIAGDAVQQGVVEVRGQVNSPGAVVITPGVTRLSEVIHKAGGITSKASLPLSYVVRPFSDSPTDREVSGIIYRNFMYSDLKLEDTLRFQLDQFYRVPYVSCSIETALADTNSSQNVPLENGDIVVISEAQNQVFVYGQVNRPGYVPYTAGKTLEWYVNQAGGYAAGAAESRSRIVRAVSKVWVEDDDGVFVQPGDEVYVPRPPAVPAGVEMQTYAMIGGILSSAVAIMATFITLLR